MAKAPSIQFYPGDVQRDTALNTVSLAAYGLWHRMMWAMFDGEPFGHLSVNGSVIPPVNLSLLLRVPLEVLEPLIAELEAAKVFSRNEAGVIYSRRMVRDAKRREVNAANGSKGGNPRLSKSVNRKVKGVDIPLTADAVSNTVLKKEEGTRAPELTNFRGITLPFSSERFAKAWSEWLAYRKKRRLDYANAESEQRQVNLLKPFDEDFAIGLLEKAIDQKYQGFVFDDTLDRYQKRKTGSGAPPAPMDRNAPIESELFKPRRAS